MQFYCYILYSQTLSKYYIGSTSISLDIRINQHNTSFYGTNKFNHTATDWVLFLSINCNSRKQAELIEKHIKSMKNKRYIENLKLFNEMQIKLLEKYNDI